MAQFISTDDANPVQCFRLCGRRGQSDGDCGIAGGTIVDASYGPRVAEIEDATARVLGRSLNGLSIRTGISIIPMATPPLPRPMRRSSPMPIAVRAY